MLLGVLGRTMPEIESLCQSLKIDRRVAIDIIQVLRGSIHSVKVVVDPLLYTSPARFRCRFGIWGKYVSINTIIVSGISAGRGGLLPGLRRYLIDSLSMDSRESA